MNLNDLVETNGSFKPSKHHADKLKQSDEISQQIEKFLKSGGEMEVIKEGEIKHKGGTAKERNLYTYNQAKANGRRMDEPLKAK